MNWSGESLFGPTQRIFSNMDRWRHLPACQLERRADLFFSAYLPAVVAEHTGLEVSPDVIPELPIRRDLIGRDRPSNTSVNAAFASDRSKVFFVELKTDGGSRRDRQDAYLSRCVDIGLPRNVVHDHAGSEQVPPNGGLTSSAPWPRRP
ncbi:MAG: hypothetical protein H6735_06460 [Alphaproteobacteria bacterium]|nr:hypothetical protein [Alphaproteobacteria bacterium]